jgi:CO/xanthine dehydrogenase FAD-binding subunit
MKPASFEYFAPTSLEEALDRVAEVGEEGGKILAGGQSLIPAMNFRLAQPASLVDLNRIEELFYIKPASDGGLLIGTMTRDTTIEFNAEVGKVAPMVHECLPFMAHPQIRNRGTFGGALTHGDPAGQLPVVAVAENFNLHIKSKNADRWVRTEDFYLSMYTNVIEHDEMLVEIWMNKHPAHTGTSYKQMARQAGASALVGTAVLLTIDEKDVCKDARVSFMGVSEMPILSHEISNILIGQKLSEEIIHDAVEACVTKELEPGQDMHATSDFRRHLARVLGNAAVEEAFARAKK